MAKPFIISLLLLIILASASSC